MFHWLFPKKVEKTTENTHIEIKEDFSDVSIVADYFKDITGVTFDNQLSILNAKVKSFCIKHTIYSYVELLKKISQDEALKQELINHLTTNETFFYREFNQIAELVALVKQECSPVKILCAPCATGEESYSIAIALLEAGIANTNFSITGIDINSQAINKAKEGVYRERNVRNLTTTMQQRYFRQDENFFHLSEEIKSLVDFQISNIFEDNFKKLGKFDYIFSRNMLIYFDKETKQKAVNILKSMLQDPSKKIFFGHADLL